jgi:hypothetical protein
MGFIWNLELAGNDTRDASVDGGIYHVSRC